MAKILVKNGSYRNRPVNNIAFELVKGFTNGAGGSYVTVKADGYFGPDMPEAVRIRVDSIEDVEFTDVEVGATKAPAKSVETDEEAMTRIRERFEILTEMTKAAVTGDIRAMIVSGPPGVGKSFGVEQEIDKATLFDTLAGKRLRAEVVKGSATPIGLYQTLYKYSDPNCVKRLYKWRRW